MSIYAMLKSEIGDRNPEDMTTSEARKVVNDFMDRVVVATMNSRNDRKVDFQVTEALKSFGLEYFA